MNAQEILILLNAGLMLVEQYGPKLTELLQSGDVTTEQQAALKARINALRDGSAFQGPEWSRES
jgi:hypothetical protein